MGDTATPWWRGELGQVSEDMSEFPREDGEKVLQAGGKLVQRPWGTLPAQNAKFPSDAVVRPEFFLTPRMEKQSEENFLLLHR